MSNKNRKVKAAKHVNQLANKKKTASIINRYPKIFLTLSLFLILIGISILTFGHVSAAKVGSSMMLLFFGLVLGIFANSALPPKTVK